MQTSDVSSEHMPECIGGFMTRQALCKFMLPLPTYNQSEIVSRRSSRTIYIQVVRERPGGLFSS